MTNENNYSNDHSNFDKEYMKKYNSLDMGEMLKKSEPQDRKEIRVEKVDDEDITQSVEKQTTQIDAKAQDGEAIDEFYTKQLNKNWSLADRVLNKQMYQEVQESKTKLLKASSHYRLAFYKTLLDTQLEALNEKCNAGVKMVKAHYRHQVGSFMMSKLQELAHEIKNRQFSFIEMMKEKYQYAETLGQYPSMQKRYTDSIFEEEQRYLKMLDGIIIKFGSIMDEEIKKY